MVKKKQFLKNSKYLLTEDKLKEDFEGHMVEEDAWRISGAYVWDYGGSVCTAPTNRLIHFIVIAPFCWIRWAGHFAGRVSLFFFSYSVSLQGRYFWPPFLPR